MRLTIVTGIAGAVLAVSGCAEADDEALVETETAGEVSDTADSATDEVAGATDPLAGDPAAEDGDRTSGADRTMQGRWSTKQMAGVPAALFGEAQTEAGFWVRCEGDELVFARSAWEPAGAIDMTLMADGETRTITANSSPDPMPTITGRLSAGDAFAATLAEVSEPIAVRVGGGAAFRMPASAAFREVVSNCRT